MEITTAARRHLKTFDSIRGYVGDRIYKHRLLVEEPLEDTGARALVVKNLGGWTSPTFQTTQFPQLEVQCWSDHSRSDGKIIEADAVDNAWAVAHVVDEILHQVRDQVWGESASREGLRIITCYRYREPILMTRENSKDVTGDLVYVSCAYAVTTAQATFSE